MLHFCHPLEWIYSQESIRNCIPADDKQYAWSGYLNFANKHSWSHHQW
jgi:hypothetical protein